MDIKVEEKHALVGDAFGDKQALKAGGLALKEQDAWIDSFGGIEAPDLKHKTVSYMKPEKLNPLCRNALASNDTFLCYAVRKNLLRVIDTNHGDKTLLRGHSHDILDIAFSVPDKTVLCSVDGGSPDTAESRVF